MGPQARLVDDGQRLVTGLLVAAALLALMTYAALRRPPRQPAYPDLIVTITCDTRAFSEALGKMATELEAAR